MNAGGARVGWGDARLWVIAAAALGLVARGRQYLANTSLWHDEAFVALNVLHTPYADLLGARDWHEPSPPGFLLIEKLVVAGLGPTELAFRLVPQLVGLLALLGFAALARRITGGGTSWVWTVALFGLSAALIDQASLVKHFTFDLGFAIAFAWLALRAHAAARPTRIFFAWGGLAALAPWLSYASVFSIAACGLVLGASRWQAWETPSRRAYLLAHVPALLSGILLLIPIRSQRTETVVAFWSGGFPDTQSLWHLAYWLIRTHLGLYHYLVQPVRALGPLLALAGALYCWRHQRRFVLLLLWMPIALALIASSLHYWPFGGNQHMSFAAPAVMITVAIGIDRCCSALMRAQGPPLVFSPAERGRLATAVFSPAERGRLAAGEPLCEPYRRTDFGDRNGSAGASPSPAERGHQWEGEPLCEPYRRTDVIERNGSAGASPSPAGRGRLAAAVLLGPALLLCLYHLAVPRRRHEMRPVIQYAQRHRAADDRLIVLDAASYLFYTGVDVRQQPLQVGPAQRVWIITPASKRGELAPDGQRIVDAFARRRPRLDLFQAHGAATYLFGAEVEPPRS